jgi:hypothetical protein
MSGIEDRAKAPLLKAFEATSITLSANDCETLAGWSVLKAILGEHAAFERLTPAEETEAFRRNLTIPAHYRVFLAEHVLDTKAAYERHAVTLATPAIAQRPFLPSEVKKNTQLTTLIVGRFYFHISAMRLTGLPPTALDPPRPMSLIYPRPPAIESNPPMASALDMRINTKTLDRLINLRGIRYFPDYERWSEEQGNGPRGE